MKKIRFALLFVALLLTVILTGCGGIDIAKYENYPNAENYQAGAFTYSAANVKRVEIDWIAGKILLCESTEETLSVSESDRNLEESERLHWILDGSTLYIRYCEAGKTGHIDQNQKHLTVSVPTGIELNINSVSAEISAGTLSPESLKIESVSGSVKLESVTASRADINSVSGAVSAENVNLTGDWKVETVSGSVSADRLICREAEIETTSGSVRVQLAACEYAEIETTSGSVTVALLDGLGAEMTYSTSSGSMNSKKEHTDRNGKMIFGSGSCRIDVKTSSGNLTVE